ncbi:MAG: endonuclease III, partial [Patescibacteria group bacterium]
MDERTHAEEIARTLKKAYPNAKSELNYSNEMEFAIAVMLSAQTTDKKVNEITRRLFGKYRTWEDFSAADLD